jgi:threonine dehydrogenase-like Zn-dependent dehydrogenase
MAAEQGALAEPLACVTHSSDRVDRARARYTFDGAEGSERTRNVLICGAGPAGLLFLQYLRNVKQFDGLILVSDVREKNLKLAERLGGAPVNAARSDLAEVVRELTSGERIHYLIEACGNPAVYKQVPSLIRKQATILIYGAGHKGLDISALDPIFFFEPTLVAGIGASGGFDRDGRPLTYRRALEWVHSKKVQVLPFITHRYAALEEIHNAFERDFQREDYIKGVLTLR